MSQALLAIVAGLLVTPATRTSASASASTLAHELDRSLRRFERALNASEEPDGAYLGLVGDLAKLPVRSWIAGLTFTRAGNPELEDFVRLASATMLIEAAFRTTDDGQSGRGAPGLPFPADIGRSGLLFVWGGDLQGGRQRLSEPDWSELERLMTDDRLEPRQRAAVAVMLQHKAEVRDGWRSRLSQGPDPALAPVAIAVLAQKVLSNADQPEEIGRRIHDNAVESVWRRFLQTRVWRPARDQELFLRLPGGGDDPFLGRALPWIEEQAVGAGGATGEDLDRLVARLRGSAGHGERMEAWCLSGRRGLAQLGCRELVRALQAPNRRPEIGLIVWTMLKKPGPVELAVIVDAIASNGERGIASTVRAANPQLDANARLDALVKERLPTLDAGLVGRLLDAAFDGRMPFLDAEGVKALLASGLASSNVETRFKAARHFGNAHHGQALQFLKQVREQDLLDHDRAVISAQLLAMLGVEVPPEDPDGERKRDAFMSSPAGQSCGSAVERIYSERVETARQWRELAFRMLAKRDPRVVARAATLHRLIRQELRRRGA